MKMQFACLLTELIELLDFDKISLNLIVLATSFFIIMSFFSLFIVMTKINDIYDATRLTSIKKTFYLFQMS